MLEKVLTETLLFDHPGSEFLWRDSFFCI